MARDEKPDPDRVLVSVTSYACEALGQGVITTGTRLRASHPAVAAYPQAWVEDGTPDDEVHRKQAALGMLGGPAA